MCRYQTLHQNEFGCLSSCRNCDRLQLSFGNICLSLSREKFYSLARLTDDFNEQVQSCLEAEERPMFLQTSAEEVKVLLGKAELEMLNDLVQCGIISLEINEILMKNAD
ncbi:MAG: DUF6686 family protein [Bacteroidota bacterium]